MRYLKRQSAHLSNHLVDYLIQPQRFKLYQQLMTKMKLVTSITNLMMKVSIKTKIMGHQNKEDWMERPSNGYRMVQDLHNNNKTGLSIRIKMQEDSMMEIKVETDLIAISISTEGVIGAEAMAVIRTISIEEAFMGVEAAVTRGEGSTPTETEDDAATLL